MSIHLIFAKVVLLVVQGNVQGHFAAFDSGAAFKDPFHLAGKRTRSERARPLVVAALAVNVGQMLSPHSLALCVVCARP